MVHQAPRAQHARGAGRAGRARDSHAHGAAGNRAGVRRHRRRGARPPGAPVWPRQLLGGPAGAARHRGHGRSHHRGAACARRGQLSRARAARRQKVRDALARAGRRAGRPHQPGAGVDGRPRARRAGGVGRDRPRRGVLLRRQGAGRGRPAHRHGRTRGGAALGRHRFARGGLAHDAARVPGHAGALPRRAVPVAHLAGQGAPAGPGAHAVPAAHAAVPGALRRAAAAGHPQRARRLAGGDLPAADAADCRAHCGPRARQGAGDGRGDWPGGVADARQHVGDWRCRAHAGVPPAHRHGQGGDHRAGPAAGHVRHLDHPG